MGNDQSKSRKHKGALSSEPSIAHFKIIRMIGRGSFGRVKLVEHRATKSRFAMKYFNKNELVKTDQVHAIITERDILQKVDHPFIVGLHFAFQDDANIYIVMDFMQGGDLRFHLKKKRFTQQEIIPIAIELVSVLAFLHGNGLVHRDIKPDNILLDTEGHIRLVDFNTAALVSNGKKLTLSVGTAHYMAPEVIKKEEYGNAADWWSLGITLYELIYGKTPFSDLSKQDCREAIINSEVKFSNPPAGSLDSDLVKFVQSLLIKDPEKRLTLESKGPDSILSHPLFRGVDWSSVTEKKLIPLFVPCSKSKNFNSTVDIEDMLMDELPLAHMADSNPKSNRNPKSTFEQLYPSFSRLSITDSNLCKV